MILYYVPFIIQTAAILLDEFYFHNQRGLGPWEMIGHPLDTLTVLLVYVFILLNPFTPVNLIVFISLAGFSSLFVTKDEFVHADHCDAREHWLHSILFLIHPVCFLSAALLWEKGMGSIFLFSQAVGLGLFIIYQITYWGAVWKKWI